MNIKIVVTALISGVFTPLRPRKASMWRTRGTRRRCSMKKVLASWGPGRYDAELDKDGKAFRPDGKQAGTLIPPAFGLAGVNLATWTGFGSVT